MSHSSPTVPEPPAGNPWAAEVEAERSGWYELVGLVRALTPTECMAPGYYTKPDWSVRDLLAHVGTWLAEAQVQFERMIAGTYDGHDIDIDRLNAQLLEAVADQSWEACWSQANAARTLMLHDWYGLEERDDEAGWWIAKSGGAHYTEHLARLREWAEELVQGRSSR
jgi:hypothetical protein